MPNIAIPTPPDAFFGLKFHQVAIYHEDPYEAVELWKDAGFTEWHCDTASLIGTEYGDPSFKTAEMWFNYDIMPLELEYVTYSTGQRNSRDPRDGHPPFISHLSTYVEDVDVEVDRFTNEFGHLPYHRFTTSDHSNPNVIGKKRFREAIFNTTAMLGYDIKMIQRVPWDFDPPESEQLRRYRSPLGFFNTPAVPAGSDRFA